LGWCCGLTYIGVGVGGCFPWVDWFGVVVGDVKTSFCPSVVGLRQSNRWTGTQNYMIEEKKAKLRKQK